MQNNGSYCNRSKQTEFYGPYANLSMKSIAAFQGIPTSSGQFAPMMLLVPHLRAQGFNKSVSFIQIVNILNKIQVVSYFQKQEIVTEFAKA